MKYSQLEKLKLEIAELTGLLDESTDAFIEILRLRKEVHGSETKHRFIQEKIKRFCRSASESGLEGDTPREGGTPGNGA